MMKRFHVLVAVATVIAALFAFAPGFADCGDGGSPTNHAGSCETSNNQVQCAGTATPAGNVHAGAEGVETCNDGSAATPVQGRIGASTECECLYADGDADNQSPVNGWVRLDQDGVNCDADGQQSYNSGAGESCY
jgi:hypothetical protein